MRAAAVFLTLVVIASGDPKVRTWPLTELYDTLENLPKDTSMRKYANEAVNYIFDHLRKDHKEDFGHVILPSPSGAEVWTKEELMKAVDEINTSPVIGFYAQAALGRLSEENTAPLLVPAMDISTWTRSDLLAAINDPATKPALLPYLTKVERTIKKTNENEATIVTPLGLVSEKSGPHYPLGYVFQSIYVSR